ncbi:MAG: RimK/LysX family protein [Gammaproteobacteria bacterium]|nr:RimK/LysX family protein [Gammaproteobacteria bacterium]
MSFKDTFWLASLTQGFKAIFTTFFLVGAPLAMSDSNTPGAVIAGWVEKISIGESSALLKAKLDTGANTSSIHAENIRSFLKDNKRWVRFELLLDDGEGNEYRQAFERPRVRKVRIKNHDGDHEGRSIVVLGFCFDGRQHTSQFTLADRSEFIYPVLLGRRFLSDVAVVDASETFLTQAQCKVAGTPVRQGSTNGE